MVATEIPSPFQNPPREHPTTLSAVPSERMFARSSSTFADTPSHLSLRVYTALLLFAVRSRCRHVVALQGNVGAMECKSSRRVQFLHGCNGAVCRRLRSTDKIDPQLGRMLCEGGHLVLANATRSSNEDGHETVGKR